MQSIRAKLHTLTLNFDKYYFLLRNSWEVNCHTELLDNRNIPNLRNIIKMPFLVLCTMQGTVGLIKMGDLFVIILRGYHFDFWFVHLIVIWEHAAQIIIDSHYKYFEIFLNICTSIFMYFQESTRKLIVGTYICLRSRYTSCCEFTHID